MATPKTPARKKPAAAPRDRAGALYAIVGEDVLNRLDLWLTRVNANTDGPKWARQDLVRKALVHVLDEHAEKGTVP